MKETKKRNRELLDYLSDLGVDIAERADVPENLTFA
jgi:hypothetical protein